MAGDSIRIVLVDDLPCFREVLRALLSNVPGISVVGVGKDGLEALQLVEVLKPDMLIIDHVMPRLSGLAVSGIVKEKYPSTRIILLTMDEFAAAEADKAAIVGRALIKGCPFSDILDAVFDRNDVPVRDADAILAKTECHRRRPSSYSFLRLRDQAHRVALLCQVSN